jgi:PAS domain S-box-containing protein
MARTIDRQRRESELRLRLAIRAAHIGIWDWNLETGEINYSPRAREIYGFAPDQPITDELISAATHPADLAHNLATTSRAIDPATQDKTAFYEYRIRLPGTGEIRWVLAHGEALFAEVEGKRTAVRFIGTIQDVTDRKNSEAALARSELRQRLAIDAARMAIWDYDFATDTIRGSPELNRIYGLDATAKPTAADLRACYAPGEQERVQRETEIALSQGERQIEIEFQCRLPEGDLRWILLRAELTIAEDGSRERAIGVLMDIDARKRSAERQALLLRELNHRVKNSLSVVQSLAAQSLRGDKAKPEAVRDFRDRIEALARANDVLLQQDWVAFSLPSLVAQIIEPYRDDEHRRFVVEGDNLDLPPSLNVPVALALHELCTNAAKYGALSNDEGFVRISWRRTGRHIEFDWSEHGGPPVAAPRDDGFGTRLVSKVLASQIGEVDLSFPESGVRCRMRLQADSPAQRG